MTTYDVLGHRVRPVLVAAAFALLGAAVIVVAGPAPWWVLPLGVLGPDLAFVAGLGQQPEEHGSMPPRAVPFYNLAHHPAASVVIAVAGLALTAPLVLALSVSWLSHIVWDRGVGYGLRDRRGVVIEPRRFHHFFA